MGDNSPWFLLCGLAVCWPAPLPIVAAFLLARRFEFRNPFVLRGGRGDV